MIKYFKKFTNMDCVKEYGWRHFIAHVLGTHSHARCAQSYGRFVAKGFIDGVNSVKK
ncbi:hypothetical protein ABC382_08925 [Lysinibacillus sp. 1P01SD]|uniref:hypothetical protein n=1 Tax=Lysinibacillus sp. 1P01SD TaxID=3132285 RepID=UPI0039A3D7F6